MMLRSWFEREWQELLPHIEEEIRMNPISIPVDELIHTDEMSVCSDVTCPCHGDRLKTFNEQAGITHTDALAIGAYVVELDPDTAEVSIHGANELVRLDASEAYLLLDFLYAHRDALREAIHVLREAEEQESDYQSQESPESRRNGYGAEQGVVYPHEEF